MNESINKLQTVGMAERFGLSRSFIESFVKPMTTFESTLAKAFTS
jgi:hypothetical protein